MNKQETFYAYCNEQKALLKEYEEKELKMDGIIARLPDKIADKYQEIFGKMMLFRDVNDFWNSYLDHVEEWEPSLTPYYDVDDITKWLESERKGEGIQQCFPDNNVKPPHYEASTRVVSLFYEEWKPVQKWKSDGEEEFKNKYRFEELFGAIYFLEHESTLYEDDYEELMYDKLLHMSVEEFQQPIVIPQSKLVEHIHFHLNGQVDVTFKKSINAARFYQFASTYKNPYLNLLS